MFGSNNKEMVTEARLAELLTPLTKRIEALEKTVAKQREPVAVLEEKLAARLVTATPPANELQADETETASAPQSAPTVSLATQEQTFYLSAPSADGTFREASTNEHAGSIYQLSTTDGINAHFIMLSTPDAIATAMISVSQFVKPACRIEGNTHRQPRSIITLDEGVAKREGEEWRVVKKAIVRFD